jgi:hypothetical protein
MNRAELRTRVAGWEEPCHPGSACIAHNNPLSPTMQPKSHRASHAGTPSALPARERRLGMGIAGRAAASVNARGLHDLMQRVTLGA